MVWFEAWSLFRAPYGVDPRLSRIDIKSRSGYTRALWTLGPMKPAFLSEEQLGILAPWRPDRGSATVVDLQTAPHTLSG